MRTGNMLSICVLLAAAGGWLLLSWRPPEGRDNEIEYQGQKFKLTKAYADYGDYKNDPDNLDPAENARVEEAVASAAIASTFANADEMTSAVGDIQFPGYGMTSFGELPGPDGTSLEGFVIEIPRANKDRILVFRGRRGSYTLVDDFVAPSESIISQVRERSGQLIYSTADGQAILKRPVKAK